MTYCGTFRAFWRTSEQGRPATADLDTKITARQSRNQTGVLREEEVKPQMDADEPRAAEPQCSKRGGRSFFGVLPQRTQRTQRGRAAIELKSLNRSNKRGAEFNRRLRAILKIVVQRRARTPRFFFAFSAVLSAKIHPFRRRFLTANER
jgi:hypothetical protein